MTENLVSGAGGVTENLVSDVGGGGASDRSAESPRLVRLMRRLEETPVLDRLAVPVEMVSRPLANGRLGAVLRGESAGHALHPALVGLPLGCWTSAIVLDVVGHSQDHAAAELLLEVGLGAAVPAVATGLVEWRATGHAEGRIGALHAALNSLGVAAFATSLALRRGGWHRAGITTAMAGMAVVGGAGYLGGHLSMARKVGFRAESFAEDEIGPRLERPAPSSP